MILTVTLNPLLERKFIYPSLNLNQNNRDGIKILSAGGKGINVSRQLNFLNVENIALSFAGGNNGKIFKEILFNEGIKNSLIRIDTELREAAVIINESEKKVSTFFEKNSKVTKIEADEFKIKLEKMIRTCEIAVFSGSSPCTAADSIFPFGINAANKFDKISVLDTYGNHLTDCIEASPTIIHNNINELEKSLEISLDSEEAKRDFLFRLYKKGIKQAYLTDGANPTVASNFDYHYKIKNPPVEIYDAAGSGDSFTAGIVFGWHSNLTFQETAQTASALGVINASRFETCCIKFDDIKLIKDKISISSIGKKINLTNVNKA